MLRKVIVTGSLVFSLMLSGSVSAEQQLSGAEIKMLFNDVTFVMENHLKGGQGWGYTKGDGTYIKKKGNGKIRTESWFVDEKGRFCKRGKRLRCGKIIKISTDEYHWYMNGEHTHSMSSFQKGNHL